MGDVVKSMKRALRNGKAWTLVLAAATIWSGSAAATPEGVALSGRFPYLTHGDVVEIEIEGLGRQRQVFGSA